MWILNFIALECQYGSAANMDIVPKGTLYEGRSMDKVTQDEHQFKRRVVMVIASEITIYHTNDDFM